MMATEEMLDTGQVAGLLQVTRNNVTAALKAGTLRGEKVDGQWRVPESAVEEYRRDHKGKAGKLPPERAKERSKKAAKTYTSRIKGQRIVTTSEEFEELRRKSDEIIRNLMAGRGGEREREAIVKGLVSKAEVDDCLRAVQQLLQRVEVLENKVKAVSEILAR